MALDNQEVDDLDQEDAELEEPLMQGSEAEHDTLTLGTQLNSQPSNMLRTQQKQSTSKGSLGLAMHMQSSRARRLKDHELQREAEARLEKIKGAPMRRNYRRHADAFGKLKVGVSGRVTATLDA